MEVISTKSAKCQFKAVRDEHGTPHVTAPTWREAIYALGFLHATDRPTQIFFSRTVASGQAAERIADKPELVETDRFFRRAGLHLGIERDADFLRPDVRQQLDWYCEGVNDALQDASRSLPMLVTGFRPRPWNPSSVLLIGNLLSFAGLAVGEQENERLLVDLVQTGVKPELLRELFSPYLDSVDLDVLKDVTMERRLSDDALEMLTDLPRLAGSNAWAVSPRRSATGGALLASDPHLEINRLPAIWYEVALHWGEEGNKQFAMGATLPGCPLMAVGRTEKLAWGVTYLHADTSDFFIEDVRKQAEPRSVSSRVEAETSEEPEGLRSSAQELGHETWQYRRGETWHDFRVREEPIHRKGGETLHYRVFENDQGTLGRDLTDGADGKYLSAKWVGTGEGAGDSIGCWLDVIHSPTTKEAMDVVRENSHPTLVWVFADSEGHIGRQASGWLPKRAEGHLGVVPVPAWDANNHWQGVQASEQLPSLYDPPEGYLASANEDLNRACDWMINTHRLAEYRKRRIVEVLHENHAATVEDMQALQYDVLSLQARDLLPVFLPHVPEGDFKKLLTDWDLRFTPESTAATAFQILYRHVLLEVFGHEEGIGWQRMFYLATRIGYSSMVLTAIDSLLLREDSLWWAGRDKAELIGQAALAAVAEVSQNSTLAELKPWGEVNSFHFANRYFEQSRVGRLLGFHTDRMPMPGCGATPFQGHLLQTATRESSFAPSYHFVADMSTDEAWANLPGGPSESRFSKWYKSDIARWAQGEYRRLGNGES